MRTAYVDAVATMRAGYDTGVLLDRVDAWSTQIAASVEEDPSRTFTWTDHQRAVGLLEDFIPVRAAYIDRWLAANP